MYEEIADQLEAYCDCLPDKLKRKDLVKLLEEMIWVISNQTCWANKPCETFLNSQREEVFETEAFAPCSCEGVFAFFPYYYFPIDPQSFEVFFVTLDGVEESVEQVKPKDYHYSEVTGQLKVDLRPFMGGENCCHCPKDYKLLVLYHAGYERLPECLLQLFCEILQLFYHKNNCDCESCQGCKTKPSVGGTSGAVFEDAEALERMQDTTARVERYLMRLIAKSYQRQLGLLSLCGRRRVYAWGEVI